MTSKKQQPTKAGAVELDESKLDQASGGALNLKFKITDSAQKIKF